MRFSFVRKLFTPALCLVLLCTMTLPTSAFFWNRKAEEPTVTDMTRNVIIGDTLQFCAEDFSVTGSRDAALSAITITSLPDQRCGMLCIGSQALSEGAVIRTSALDGLCFRSMPSTTDSSTTFTFRPTFTTGAQGSEVTVDVHLLSKTNLAPIAENMSLSTFRNVSVTGYFQALDSEGDPLTFQITSTPARGSVSPSEDGTSRFVYTPYENKTGKDSFTFVAVDSAGNQSNPGKVTIRIQKADTQVTYADMNGHAACKSAIRLAQEGIFVGECVNGQYFFRPEQSVSRSEFLTMAMSVAGLDPLEDVSVTGFADDIVIPTWAKGYVSSALKAGVIQGSRNAEGKTVFNPDAPVTRAEATVMLNQLLQVSDVAVQTWASAGIEGDASTHWALQSAANLATAGIISVEASRLQTIDTTLTRADVAEMLDNSLDVLAARKQESWFIW